LSIDGKPKRLVISDDSQLPFFYKSKERTKRRNRADEKPYNHRIFRAERNLIFWSKCFAEEVMILSHDVRIWQV
jgi:hypothetical protein